MSCICFSANMSISANKLLFWTQQQYFCICICFPHKKGLEIIPNVSCILFMFNRIGSSGARMSEIDGLGQLTSDDLWGLMLLHNRCKQFQNLILRRSFVPYSFVRHRNNIWNFTIYIYYNVLTILNSFLPSNLTEISWMGQTLFGCRRHWYINVNNIWKKVATLRRDTKAVNEDWYRIG